MGIPQKRCSPPQIRMLSVAVDADFSYVAEGSRKYTALEFGARGFLPEKKLRGTKDYDNRTGS